MNSRSLLFAALIACMSSGASASPTSALTVDLTKNFRNQGVNMMADENQGQHYVDVVIPNPANVDYTLVVIANQGGKNVLRPKGLACRTVGLMKRGSALAVRIEPYGLDDGDTCFVNVSYSNGRKASVSIISQGT